MSIYPISNDVKEIIKKLVYNYKPNFKKRSFESLDFYKCKLSFSFCDDNYNIVDERVASKLVFRLKKERKVKKDNHRTNLIHRISIPLCHEQIGDVFVCEITD